ncbi:MAG TPA: hypothetical protein VGC13_23935 [Longimicrobium sp.]|uniref:hypothetical protein n=1 Tax=Longimicrobium sp. TaxID=2029185 RepID=UPI002ED7C22A
MAQVITELQQCLRYHGFHRKLVLRHMASKLDRGTSHRLERTESISQYLQQPNR